MTAPDDGHISLPGLGARLRAELTGTVVRSQAELADRILDSLQREHHRLIFDHGRIWRYDTATGLFLTMEDAEIANIVYDLDGIPFGERGHLNVTAHFARGIAQIIKDRTSHNGFFGNSPTGVAVANGFLMEQDGHVVLRPHSPEHRQQFQLEISYQPNANTSAIDEFLLETFDGDQSLIDLIYEIIGVAIFGCGTRYHVVFVFCGDGANGKGVIVTLIQMLIPDGMRSSVPPSQMHLDYQLFPLVGSRFNAVGELATLDSRNLQALKSICAGDTITVRRVRERQTVSQFLEEWLENSARPTIRPSTYVRYGEHVRNHISPAIGHIKLAKLTPQHVQALLNEKLGEGLAEPRRGRCVGAQLKTPIMARKRGVPGVFQRRNTWSQL